MKNKACGKPAYFPKKKDHIIHTHYCNASHAVKQCVFLHFRNTVTFLQHKHKHGSYDDLYEVDIGIYNVSKYIFRAWILLWFFLVVISGSYKSFTLEYFILLKVPTFGKTTTEVCRFLHYKMKDQSPCLFTNWYAQWKG